MNLSKSICSINIAVIAIACLLMAGCAGGATREIAAERASLHSEPVTMKAKDLSEASITPSGAVSIGEKPLTLTGEQQTLARDYRSAVIELVDLTLSETSSIANHAVSRVLLATLVGRGDEAGEKIGKQAEALKKGDVAN